MDYGQALTVVTVCVRPYGMLKHMALEVGLLAQFEQAVLRHRRSTYQLSVGEVVRRVGDECSQVLNHVAHHSLVNLVRQVSGLQPSHIRLHAVAQSVERTAYNLLHRHCKCQVTVQYGKAVVSTDKWLLQMQLRVGYHRSVVLLGAGARCSHDSTRRDKRRRSFVLRIHHLPHIFSYARLC